MSSFTGHEKNIQRIKGMGLPVSDMSDDSFDDWNADVLVEWVDELLDVIESQSKERVDALTKEVKRLTKRDDFLTCLERNGVDSWQGYGEAQEIKAGWVRQASSPVIDGDYPTSVRFDPSSDSRLMYEKGDG